MTSYEFGDVLLVPFPFTDQSTEKKRPAVVVSSEAYHRERPDLILMAVSSQVRLTAFVGEIIVQHWQEAGLRKPSVIKPVLPTIEEGLVLKRLGRLTQEDRRTLLQALHLILGDPQGV